MSNSTEKEFYSLFTELQCSVLANANKSSASGITATHYNIIEASHWLLKAVDV